MQIDHFLRGNLPDIATVARDLEAIGFDGVYTAEAVHDPFLPLMLAAEHTSRVTVFTSIAVAFARNPMDLAQVADGIQRDSGGRFALGLGSQIRPHITNRFSMPWGSPVARMREMVEAVKAIQRAWQDRTPLDYRGELYRHTLMTPFFDPGPNPHGPPPVWVAGLGPRMTAVAAEVADGLLIHPFHSGKFVHEHVAPAVAEGLGRTGRDRASFMVHATPIVCTGSTDEELERARVGARGLMGFYGSTPAYRVTLDAHGWGDLQTELNRLTKQGRWSAIGDVIPDEVLDTVAVCGKPDEIATLVTARYGSAVDRIGVSMPYDVSRATLEAMVTGFHTDMDHTPTPEVQ